MGEHAVRYRPCDPVEQSGNWHNSRRASPSESGGFDWAPPEASELEAPRASSDRSYDPRPTRERQNETKFARVGILCRLDGA
jgi:hypothetical protein